MVTPGGLLVALNYEGGHTEADEDAGNGSHPEIDWNRFDLSRLRSLHDLYGPKWPLTFTDEDWTKSLDTYAKQQRSRELAERVYEAYSHMRASLEKELKERRDRGEEVEPFPSSLHMSPPSVEPQLFELEIEPWHLIVSEALSLDILPTRIVEYIFNVASSPSSALHEYLDRYHGIPEHLVEEAQRDSDSESPSSLAPSSGPSIDETWSLAGDSDGSEPIPPSP